MPVTTVTGHVSLVDSRVPEGRQQFSRGSLSSLPGLWNHQRPYPSAIADGIEPPSLPGLSRIARFCFTQYFQQNILNGVADRSGSMVLPRLLSPPLEALVNTNSRDRGFHPRLRAAATAVAESQQ